MICCCTIMDYNEVNAYLMFQDDDENINDDVNNIFNALNNFNCEDKVIEANGKHSINSFFKYFKSLKNLNSIFLIKIISIYLLIQ